MKILNLIFNAFGITLTAAAVYGAMDGQIVDPSVLGSSQWLSLPTSLKREVFESKRPRLRKCAT
jgi:hypothetical protein